MPTFRPNTNDEIIWNNINEPEHNEYRLPDDMVGWTVIDIGAHIGGFTNACLKRGATNIIAFEPFPDNYDLLFENIIDFSNVSIFPYAVYRSDQSSRVMMGQLYISDYDKNSEPPNTGSPSLVPESSIPIKCIGFDTIILSKVDLVKLDCEGSEWPILFTSKKLRLIDRIIGEYHECTFPLAINGKAKFTIEDLVTLLNNEGFEVEHFRHGDSNLGMFFAERKGLNG